jgi:transcriptional regulator with XRE-family HTH domain
MSKKKKQIQEHQRKRLEEISRFIKNYRICENLSQREYSKIADTHVNTLQKFEKQKTKNISVHTLFAFIDAMDGMTLSEFFAGMQ